MYPIIDEQGNPAWPGKYPNQEAIEKEKARGIPDREWAIEYMLQPIIDEDQIIKVEWIRYYDREPHHLEQIYRYAATGVDLAISEKETADFTAMVSGIVTHEDGTWKLYVLPFPINKRLNGPAILEEIVSTSLRLGNGKLTDMFIENVGSQQIMVDMANEKGIHAEGFSPAGRDKRARLISISELIKSGRIRFPRHGAEKLIQQVLWLGIEKHDDLMDALITLVLSIFEREKTGQIIVPKLDAPTTPTLKESERKADFDLIYQQEIGRGDDPRTARMRYEFRKSQKESREYWIQEERVLYNGMI